MTAQERCAASEAYGVHLSDEADVLDTILNDEAIALASAMPFFASWSLMEWYNNHFDSQDLLHEVYLIFYMIAMGIAAQPIASCKGLVHN